MSSESPLVKSLTADIDATAKGSDATVPVGAAPFAGTVESVTYTPIATLTGAATNYRTLSLINKGAKNEGTTVVATLAFSVNTVVATANVQKAITLNAEVSKLVVAEGDVLEWSSTHTGEGLADPGGEVTVKVSRS